MAFYWGILLNEGILNNQLNHYQAAINACSKELKAYNDKKYYIYETSSDLTSAILIYEIGNAKLAMKVFQGALDDCNYSINLTPNNPAESFYLTRGGRLYFEIGNYVDALKDLTDAVKSNPKDSDA